MVVCKWAADEWNETVWWFIIRATHRKAEEKPRDGTREAAEEQRWIGAEMDRSSLIGWNNQVNISTFVDFHLLLLVMQCDGNGWLGLIYWLNCFDETCRVATGKEIESAELNVYRLEISNGKVGLKSNRIDWSEWPNYGNLCVFSLRFNIQIRLESKRRRRFLLLKKKKYPAQWKQRCIWQTEKK